MNPEQREELIRLLQHDEEISPEWARILFPPEKREYELVYQGKDREEDIIADTLAVPLQQVRTFGKNGVNWHNKLIFGDNLQVLKTLVDLKRQGQLTNADGTPGVRLIYIDPPFATKQEFRGSDDQKAYQDKIAGAQFVDFLRRRLVLIRELLADDGSLYMHLDQKKTHYAKVILDEVFGEHNFRNEIIWRNTNAHNKAETFGQIHQTILFYTKGNSFRFNKTFHPRFRKYVENHYRHTDKDGESYRLSDLTGEGVRDGDSGKTWRGYNPTAKMRHWAIPSYVYDLIDKDISDLKLLKKLDYLYEQGFIKFPDKKGGQPQIKRWESIGSGNPIQDLWAYQPYTEKIYVGSNDAIDQDVSWATSENEVTGYPTQKPEGLLDRIIKSSSDIGDIVLDAFAGSGTTLAVAEKTSRRWIGIDCGKLSIYTVQKRMLSLCNGIGNQGSKLDVKPFTLYNAGLYDFSKLKELSWHDWRFFALQLFQCRDEKHSIGGIELDGYRQGSSVLVFNHTKHPDARFTEETLQEIHEALSTRIGNKVFIIAPALTFDFQQDYIDMGDVRYYALRIPYSMIHELHRREFTALKQPSDELAVNDTVEAVGFDFIRTPELKYKTGKEKQKGELFENGFIRIDEFKSDAVVREPFKKRGNLETLSTVMIDYDYNESTKVFDLDEVHYAEDIRKKGWKITFSLEQLGGKIMAVFLDIYGNEAKVLIDGSSFGTIKKPKNTNKKKAKLKK